MEPASVSFKQLATASKHFARRLLTIGENRLELLTVEVQEEGKHLLHAILVALGVATFGLLAGVAFTGVVVVLFWNFSPVAALVALTSLYGTAAFVFYRRLAGMLHDWNTLSATLDQLRKDRACLEKTLE
ncbi:MAG: phage holin family protein [Verrucomicrobia bacterium]|nr:phage holin family protein [Verrucomicrobiota bacterium]